jgi:hypothetical protein
MSYDEDDARWEEGLESLYQEWLPQAREDLYSEIIDDFTSDRLRSYYFKEPKIAQNAMVLLNEASALLSHSPRAALVFSVAATELTIKDGFVEADGLRACTCRGSRRCRNEFGNQADRT